MLYAIGAATAHLGRVYTFLKNVALVAKVVNIVTFAASVIVSTTIEIIEALTSEDDEELPTLR